MHFSGFYVRHPPFWGHFAALVNKKPAIGGGLGSSTVEKLFDQKVKVDRHRHTFAVDAPSHLRLLGKPR
jgi:hypothetical protein